MSTLDDIAKLINLGHCMARYIPMTQELAIMSPPEESKPAECVIICGASCVMQLRNLLNRCFPLTSQELRDLLAEKRDVRDDLK